MQRVPKEIRLKAKNTARAEMFSTLKSRYDLAGILNELGLLGTAVEVGVFRGTFPRGLLEEWKGQKLVLVDPWRHLEDYFDSWNLTDSEMEQNYQQTLSLLASFKERVQILRMRSEEAAPLVPNASCDFIHIDANHSYEAVKRDLQLWFPKLRIGGVMSGHDYFDALADEQLEPILPSVAPLKPELLSSYGVKSAVDEFVLSRGITLNVTPEDEPTWYFLKTQET